MILNQVIIIEMCSLYFFKVALKFDQRPCIVIGSFVKNG